MFSLSHKILEHFSKVSFLLLLVRSSAPANIAHSLELSFAWDTNTAPDLAGYRVFYRQEGQDYDYNSPAWEGTATSCTINGLDDSTTYYFVSRAYDTFGNESENSVELFYEPEIIEDRDGDGTENGVIIDPSGLATVSSNPAVTT